MKLCVLDVDEDIFSENGPMFRNINLFGTIVRYFLYRKQTTIFFASIHKVNSSDIGVYLGRL